MNRPRAANVSRRVKRTLLFVIALLASHAAPVAASAPPIVCDAGTDHVVYDGKTASYSSAGKFVGSSECGGTRMAIYDMRCDESPAFAFFFAGVPGPAVLGGKSARLDVAGKTTLMSCK